MKVGGNRRGVQFVEAAPFINLMNKYRAAEAAGSHHRTWMTWRASNRIPREKAAKIAAAAGVDPRDLLPSWDAGINDLPDRRFPFEPLARYYSTLAGLSRDLNYRYHGWEDWENGLPIDIADKAATCIGKHPFEIWPDWFDDLETP